MSVKRARELLDWMADHPGAHKPGGPPGSPPLVSLLARWLRQDPASAPRDPGVYVTVDERYGGVDIERVDEHGQVYDLDEYPLAAEEVLHGRRFVAGPVPTREVFRLYVYLCQWEGFDLDYEAHPELLQWAARSGGAEDPEIP